MNQIAHVEVTLSPWRWLPRLTLVAAAVVVAILLFAQSSQSPTVNLMAQSAQAMSNLQTAHITARMRTAPNDNFEYIDPNADWLSQFNRWSGQQQERCAAAQREADDALRRVCEENQSRLRAEAEAALEMLKPKPDARLEYFKEHSIA
jgi:hypothetical protein